jgi:hypothetical protein
MWDSSKTWVNLTQLPSSLMIASLVGHLAFTCLVMSNEPTTWHMQPPRSVEVLIWFMAVLLPAYGIYSLTFVMSSQLYHPPCSLVWTFMVTCRLTIIFAARRLLNALCLVPSLGTLVSLPSAFFDFGGLSFSS